MTASSSAKRAMLTVLKQLCNRLILVQTFVLTIARAIETDVQLASDIDAANFETDRSRLTQGRSTRKGFPTLTCGCGAAVGAVDDGVQLSVGGRAALRRGKDAVRTESQHGQQLFLAEGRQLLRICGGGTGRIQWHQINMQSERTGTSPGLLNSSLPVMW